jgi:hypothetical protein
MAQTPLRRIEDRQFAMMEVAYRRHGGLASGDDVARLLRRRTSQPLSILARWIVDRQIVNFRWQSRLLVPLFQFAAEGMNLRPLVLQVIDELAPTMDDWMLAYWFAEPDAQLGDRCPLDLLDSDPLALCGAARARRRSEA